MVQFQTMRFADPSASASGLATNPCKDRKIRSRIKSGSGGGNKGEAGRKAGTDVRVVLAPGLALLR
jgi:hypothetical protein